MKKKSIYRPLFQPKLRHTYLLNGALCKNPICSGFTALNLILHLSGSKGLMIENGSNDLTVLENTNTSTKHIRDHDSVIRKMLPGEIGFLDGRRITNSAPSDLSSWVNIGAIVTGDEIDNVDGTGWIKYISDIVALEGDSCWFTVELKAGTLDKCKLFVLGSSGGFGIASVEIRDLTSDWVTYAIKSGVLTSNGDTFRGRIRPDLDETIGTVFARNPLIVKATALEASPPSFIDKDVTYNAGVPGVFWSNLLNANTVTDSVVTEVEGALITPAPVILHEPAYSWLALHNRDLTDAVWVTVNMTTSKTATGPDDIVNSASIITSTAANATVLQTIALASTERITGAYVKRRTGSGTVEMTQDSGVTWTAIAVTAEWTFEEIPAATLANPILGFRIITSGDAVDVDYVGHQEDNWLGMPIEVTTAAGTVDSDLLRLPVVLNRNIYQDQIHMILRIKPQYDSTASLEGWFSTSDTDDSVISDSATINTISATDGTNTANRALAWAAGDELHINFLASADENIMAIGVIKNGAVQVWSANATYDNFVTLGLWLNWMYGNDNVVHILGQKTYKTLQGGTTILEAKAWSDLNTISEMALPGE